MVKFIYKDLLICRSCSLANQEQGLVSPLFCNYCLAKVAGIYKYIVRE